MYDNCGRDTCPCCGYNSLGEEYEPCLVCYWTHDLVQEREPDSAIGANGISLRDAQSNFSSFGLAYQSLAINDPLESRLRGHTRDSNWKPLEAGHAKPLRACPCCGYVTIGGDWDNCRVCGWEADRSQQINPDAEGFNWVTLRDAQRNFALYGASLPSIARVVSPLAERVSRFPRDPDWKPLPQATRCKAYHTCPCCGYLTITRSRDICGVCHWITDRNQEADPDCRGENGVTLREAQQSFRELGYAYPLLAPHGIPIEEWSKQFTRDPNWKPITPPTDLDD